MIYDKGYTPLNESKKVSNPLLIFLSSRAEKTTKSSNSMFFFEEAAKKRGLSMITIDPSSSTLTKESDGTFTVLEVSGGKKKTYSISPKKCIVIPRRTILKNSESKDFTRELESNGFFMMNTLDSIEVCEDKFLTYKRLKNNGVASPRTAIVSGSSLDKLQSKVDSIGGKFPVICKLPCGTQGNSVFIIDSMMSLKSTLQTMTKLVPKADIILQEKVESNCDYRVHVLYKGFERMSKDLSNYEVIGCMQRNVMDGDFRSNYSLGATAEKGYLTPEQEKVAKQAAAAVGCRWCGVDLIVDNRTKQPYILEVNASAGTKGITTEAGDDVVGAIMDMFKDFKYTKYDSDEIGKYETATIKNLGDGMDVVVKFDTNKSFTELECSSVNSKDDEVVFVFGGSTYKMELSGMRKGDPMVEFNIKFNGSVYKNELVVLKQVNGINTGIMTSGSKFTHRISDKAIISNDSFVLTDNTTDFDVPVEKITESMLLNESVELQVESVDITGLRKLIERYVMGYNDRYTKGNWLVEGIDREAKDSWVLSYKDYDIVGCEENYAWFKNTYLPYETACKVAGVIESFYGHSVDMTVYKQTN